MPAEAEEHRAASPDGATEKEARRALVERVAASPQFRRSTRLREFLLYVGLRAAEDPAAEIHEQEIGERVFERSRHYDTSQDNIVRVNATELRRRVDTYFATEGILEPVSFTIPRGSYLPIFQARGQHEPGSVLPLPVAAPVAVPVPAPAANEPTLSAKEPVATLPLGGGEELPPGGEPMQRPTVAKSPARVHLAWAAACAAVAVASVAGTSWWQSSHRLPEAARETPEVTAFWSHFANPAHPADIVLPDDSLSVAEDVLKRPVQLSDYLDRSYKAVMNSPTLSADRQSDVWQILNHNLITLGAFHAAQQILSLPGLAGGFRLTAAHFYGADSIKRNNVLLLGGKKANPWVGLMEADRSYVLDFDYAAGTAYVVDRHPAPGAPARYTMANERNALAGYSIVAYLPNPSRTGDVIIIEGSDSDSTAAASEFLTSETHLRRLESTLHTDHLPYFEALLRNTRISGTSFNAQIVAVHRFGDAGSSPH